MKDGLKLRPAVLGRHVLGLCDDTKQKYPKMKPCGLEEKMKKTQSKDKSREYKHLIFAHCQ